MSEREPGNREVDEEVEDLDDIAENETELLDTEEESDEDELVKGETPQETAERIVKQNAEKNKERSKTQDDSKKEPAVDEENTPETKSTISSMRARLMR